VVFTTETPDLRIYISRLGRPVAFENGRYETTDRGEIAALRRNRFVTAEPEPKPPGRRPTPEPPNPGGADAGDKPPPE
jgi:hypothetical protein